MERILKWPIALAAWRALVGVLLGALLLEQDIPAARQCVALAERLLRQGLGL